MVSVLAHQTREERIPHLLERQPLYFGTGSRPLFGWLHRPSHAAGSLCLVICSAFGNEGICSHRSVRHLAERAAAAGIPTLRFDYDGTGDSAGHDYEPDRLAAWIASVRAAADEILSATGATRLCFAGIRLGAAMAALAALERGDVTGLIAIAPVIAGKAYVREMRLLTRAMEAKGNRAAADGTALLQTAGFVLGAQTQESLLEIDLKRLNKAPATRVLVLDRAELPAGDGWVQHLRATGARADRIVVSGYTEMMLDSHETVVPEEIIASTLHWLEELASEPGGARHRVSSHSPWPDRDRAVFTPGAAPNPVTGESPQTLVEEVVVRFGPAANLFGIISAPPARARERAATDLPAVLLLNAGAVHHVGPNRLYVALARHLARSGQTVLRMDIAGIGDSPAHAGDADNVVYSRSALDDMGAAIELLRRDWGAREVRAVGLCSGAYHAFKAGVAGLPLNQAVMINPLTFFAKEGMSLKYPEHRVAADIMRYRTNALRFSSWLKLLRGRVNLWELAHVLARRVRGMTVRSLRAPARWLGISIPDDLPGELRAALKHNVELHFVFAQGDPGLELLRTQGGGIARRLLARGQIGLEQIEGADHTFTDLNARAKLAAKLSTILSAPAKHRPRGG